VVSIGDIEKKKKEERRGRGREEKHRR